MVDPNGIMFNSHANIVNPHATMVNPHAIMVNSTVLWSTPKLL